MKKTLPFLIYVLLAIAMGSLLYHTLQRRAQKKQVTQQMQQLPEFTFYSLQGDSISQKDVAKGKPLCIIYMDPDCHFCEEEMKDILTHIERFSGSQLLLVSPAREERLQQYQEEMDLVLLPEVLLARDRDFTFSQYFGTATTPTIIIYGADGRLQKKYSGQTKIEAILAHLDR
ncbi:peroxiredoxin family protein [Olivibacter sitiensis]|uniref:peroxiredoxin family protein n=1 Tax=Olivibacter sitiensis TaxID=376470 RepID=UPI0003F6996E|nr:redoxin domain-containing protein [Olivibacter sitiensis]